MNCLLVVVLFALIASINAKINTTNIPETSYLFSYFDNDEKAGLRLAYSTDGYTFEALNDNKVLLTPKIGDKILRDPCILYGPDHIFHLVYTTSWHNKEIGYASSKDLVHWSEEVLIPVMHNETATQQSWAPEVIYDNDKKHYLIYWASSIKGKLADAFHIYCTTTTDFKTFTPTKLFYSKEGENEIDATLLYDTDHNEWLLFNKIWSTDFEAIDVLKSASLSGPWTLLSKNIIPKIIGEGPTSVKIGKYYHVYFDKYKENHMGLTRSTDLIEWEDMSSHIKFPPHAKHGTVFKVTPDIVKLISSAGL